MRIHRLTKLLTALVLATWPASAMAQLQGENLLTGIPEGFKVGYEASQDGQEIHEFVPQAESVEDWSSMVTIQIFHGAQGADVGAFAADMGQGWQGSCPGAVAGEIGSGDVNGYPYVVWGFACPLNVQTGEPETMWMKAISGADAAYVVQYAFRLEPSAELKDPALTYLDAVSVCDVRKPDQACPAGM